MPWYRDVRTVHGIPGGNYGYRNGSGKFPPYFIDSLPAVRDLGRGSPVGVEFYQHTVYPKEFRDAYFEADWSRGRLLWTGLERTGATYKATKEKDEFVHGEPLNITDVEVGPGRPDLLLDRRTRHRRRHLSREVHRRRRQRRRMGGGAAPTRRAGGRCVSRSRFRAGATRRSRRRRRRWAPASRATWKSSRVTPARPATIARRRSTSSSVTAAGRTRRRSAEGADRRQGRDGARGGGLRRRRCRRATTRRRSR